MATKIKVFDLRPDNSKEITDFLNSVNVTKEGFLINDGRLGILYKDKSDFGRDTSELLVVVSEQLAIAQKNYVIRELDLCSYRAQKVFFEAKRDEARNKLEIAKTALKDYDSKWDKGLEDQFNTLKSEFAALEKKHRQAGKLDKEKLLEEIHLFNTNKLKPCSEDFQKMKLEFEEGRKKLQVEASDFEVQVVNLQGEVKTLNNNIEDSETEKETAKIAVEEARKVIKELEAGNLVI